MPSFDEVVRDMFWGNGPVACSCMGPRDGEPVCPCAMRNVRIVDGHYVQVTDLGKVSDPAFKKVGYRPVNVVITGYTNKLKAIKAVRALTGMGLAASRNLIENLPVYMSNVVSEATGQEIIASLKNDEVTAELKATSNDDELNYCSSTPPEYR